MQRSTDHPRSEVDGKDLRKRFAAHACLLIGLHVVVSLAILRPGYFAAFFGDDGALTVRAELSMLAGAVAALAVAALAVPKWRASLGGVLGRVPLWTAAMVLSLALHVVIMGFPDWTTPTHWPGFLPPMTLIAFVTIMAAALARRS